MNFFRNLLGAFSSKPETRYHTFTVKCRRCGELIPGRVDLDHDLSVEYEEGGHSYYVRKVLIGSGICFQSIEARMKFSSAREFIEAEVTGGEIVS